jgi:hypothetical protein
MNEREGQSGKELEARAGGFILQHIPKCHVRFPLPAAKGHKRSQAFELSESLDPLICKKTTCSISSSMVSQQLEGRWC